MSKNGVIIGTFVKKELILTFLEGLKNKFKLNMDKIYVYNVSSNSKEYLVTFRTFNKDEIIKDLPGSAVLHVKNKCLFSINAINRLIESQSDYDSTKPHNEVEIDWGSYENKLIILSSGVLSIKDLEKIENKNIFLQ